MSANASSSAAEVVIYACVDCSGRYLSTKGLSKHQKRASHGPYRAHNGNGNTNGPRQTWFLPVADDIQGMFGICGVCTKRRLFNRPLALWAHMCCKGHRLYGVASYEKRKTPDFREFCCTISPCNYTDRSLDALHMHIRDEHPNIINWFEDIPSSSQNPPWPMTGDGKPVATTNTAAYQGWNKAMFTLLTDFTCEMAGCTERFHDTAIGLHNHEVQVHQLPKEQQKSQKYAKYCHICNEPYWSNKEMKEHKRQAHLEQYRCLDCDIDFENLSSLNKHLKNHQVHAPRPISLQPPPNTCGICNKTFRTAAGLESHSASRIHNPIAEDLPCIRPGCNRKFNSPSAMLHHLESGGCSPLINVLTVNKAIIDNDPTRIITTTDAGQELEDWWKGQHSLMDGVEGGEFEALPIGGGNVSDADAMEICEDDETEGGVHVFTPNTFDSVSGGVSVCLSGEMTPESYMNTSRQLTLLETTSISGKKYLCSLCPTTNHFFQSQEALERHLSSAAHAPKIFHCPISLIDDEIFTERKKPNHLRMFTTLSGLAQHLEAEACKGGKVTFEKVVKFVEAKLREMGFEGRLLA